MVAFRAMLSSFLLPIFFLQSIQAVGLFDFESNVSNHSLVARQAVVDAGACLSVDLQVPGIRVSALVTLQPIVLARGVCICAQGQGLTPASLLVIRNSISAQEVGVGGVALTTLVNALGGLDAAVVAVANTIAPRILALPSATCPYPANSVANECGGCGYVCKTDFTLDAGLCCAAGTTASNGVCCPAGQTGSGGICCTTGTTASNGVCCSDGFTGCNGACVATGTLCCPSGTTASNGVCCPANQFGCNGVCVATGTLCCASGTTESNGVCCPANQFGCNGVCVATGTTCCPTGQQACLGVCVASNVLCCALGQQACNGVCIASSAVCCATGQFACGTTCVTNGVICQSGIVIDVNLNLKRNFNSASCPIGHEACRIPSSPRSRSLASAFECINTANDLESCGGCVQPLPGRPQGQDCSAIPDVDSAVCQAGRCVIESCARGFINNGTACINGISESAGRKLSGYWAALQEATHVILQE